MAQRISRAKRALAGPPARRLDRPGDLAVVLRVFYLVYTAGHIGPRIGARPPRPPDLAREAIRLARQLTLATEEPEARGLLAPMLLNHARLPARLDPEGRIVTLDRQDRDLWDTREIAEGVRVLQSALAVQRPGRYQLASPASFVRNDGMRPAPAPNVASERRGDNRCRRHAYGRQGAPGTRAISQASKAGAQG